LGPLTLTARSGGFVAIFSDSSEGLHIPPVATSTELVSIVLFELLISLLQIGGLEDDFLAFLFYDNPSDTTHNFYLLCFCVLFFFTF
jgi:hypothetical protein